MMFGCGQDNGGLFNRNGSGMIGLGRGPVSLISQMSSSIDGKFSSCLVHAFSGFNSSSTMSFGIEAVVSGTTVYLRLEAMSVGRKRLRYNSSMNPSLAPAKGNIIVDSGTTLTLLLEDLYNKLELTEKKARGNCRKKIWGWGWGMMEKWRIYETKNYWKTL
ncbi:unnamed protein product [Malus baccata var. baccata]